MEGQGVGATLGEVGLRALLRDALMRFRLADGFSHSRALAFQFALALVPALIAVVGFAHQLGQQNFSLILSQSFQELAPGPAGEVVTQAIDQGSGSGGGGTALFFGLLAALVAGATAMGQIERGFNRIYGVERDRPTLAKYTRATALALTAGIATLLALVLLVAGDDIRTAANDVIGWSETLDTAWAVGRWPLGALLVAGAVTLLFKASPRRDQPAFPWLALGSAVAVALWFAFTGLLAAYVEFSQEFGETYGPLAGVIGLLLWTFGTALALFLGLAVAAQLEAVRAGSPDPGSEPADRT